MAETLCLLIRQYEISVDSGDHSWLDIENKFLAYMKELAVTQIYLMCLY